MRPNISLANSIKYVRFCLKNYNWSIICLSGLTNPSRFSSVGFITVPSPKTTENVASHLRAIRFAPLLLNDDQGIM